MPIVNYVREHRRFIEYAADEHMTGPEMLLWYALMHIMNQRAEGKIWPDEFIRINNDRVLSLCPFGYDTLISARNALKQRGLIDFQGGQKNKKSPSYRMIYFYPGYAAPDIDSDDKECIPEMSDKKKSIPEISIYDGVYGRVYDRVYKGGNEGDLYINYTKDIRKRLPEDEEEEEEDLQRAREEEVRMAWETCFGCEPAPAVRKSIAWRGRKLCGFDKGVLDAAIHTAALSGARNPLSYLLSVMADWRHNRVKTVQDAEEYLFLHDASVGKCCDVMYPEEADRKIEEFRQDRETDEERAARISKEKRREEEAEKRRRQIAENQQLRNTEEGKK